MSLPESVIEMLRADKSWVSAEEDPATVELLCDADGNLLGKMTTLDRLEYAALINNEIIAVISKLAKGQIPEEARAESGKWLDYITKQVFFLGRMDKLYRVFHVRTRKRMYNVTMAEIWGKYSKYHAEDFEPNTPMEPGSTWKPL